MDCDVLVVGGGLGGCAAAMAAAQAGLSVVMTEETDWIGGQSTAQAVPPDENPWIESIGCSPSYAQYRQGIRDYYRQWFPLTDQARASETLNPGGGWVSSICHLPRISVAVLRGMLHPYEVAGNLTVLLEHEPIHAEVDGDCVRAVSFRDFRSDSECTIDAAYVIDATETGKLLSLSGCEYVTGCESQSEQGELHAPEQAQPLNMQAVTWCFAMELAEGNHIINKPVDYNDWKSYQPTLSPAWPGTLFSWTYSQPATLRPITSQMEVIRPEEKGSGAVSLWSYRQISDPSVFHPSSPLSQCVDDRLPGITLANWPQMDYMEGCLFDVPDAKKHWRAAKEMSRCFFYWLQTEAPRLDGGTGWPGLRLRGDLLGTDDGFAKYPYIRESRRIPAQFTVTENHVGILARDEVGYAEPFNDSVGIGHYSLDMHPTTQGCNYKHLSSYPFQIPLGALIPVRLKNLIPACKNIGTTHISSGAYRLHPVEWNIGLAAGELAALCIAKNIPSQVVGESPERVRTLQSRLVQKGTPLQWPEAEMRKVFPRK